MKSIAFIVPWSGKLPEYFPLWLNTCKWNPTIDFLLFTDDTKEFEFPDNVKVYYKSFKEMVDLVQKHFDFKISLNKPYKFCDFRPAFGEIFEEYLKGYDFWGHCDLDMFWGDIRKFLTNDILCSYKKIFSRGHCNLYKNTKEINSWYKNLPNNGCQEYKTVFQTDKPCCFDEWTGHCGGGISQIIKSNNIRIFDEVYSADLNVMKGYFKINRREDLKSKRIYFVFDNGKLKVINNNIEEEIMCVHFQKRKLKINMLIDKNKFYFISPNCVVNSNKNGSRNRMEEKIYEYNMLNKKVKNKIKDIVKIRKE